MKIEKSNLDLLSQSTSVVSLSKMTGNLAISSLDDQEGYKMWCA